MIAIITKLSLLTRRTVPWRPSERCAAGCWLVLWCAAGLVRADSLYFQAQPDGMGGVNYNWFSVGNWFQPDTMGVLQPANKIPGPGDSVFLLTKVNAAANAITIGDLTVQPGIGVSGGSFTVGQVVTLAGAGFTNSAINLQAQMFVSGGCTMNATTLTVDAGAACRLNGPATNSSVGFLVLSNSTIINLGQINLTNGSSITGGSNFVNRGYVISVGAASFTGTGGTFDNDGIVQCLSGTLAVGPFATWTNSLAAGQYEALATNATIQFGAVAPGPTFPANTTNWVTGSGSNTFPYGATVNGLLQVGLVDAFTHAVNTGLAVLSSQAVSLTGSGVVHVVAAAGAASSLLWNGGTISGVELDLDAGGQFTMSGTADRYFSGATVNSAGVTTTRTQGTPMHLNNGAVFNNLAGGLFDAQNDAGIVGSGGGSVGRFNNIGTFRKSAGTGDTGFAFDNGANQSQTPVFNNSGLLDVQTGRVVLGGGTNSGQFNVAAGARLRFIYNTNVQVGGASFTGPGQVSPDGGGTGTTLVLETGIGVPNFALGNATVDGPGDLAISNAFAWNGGTLQGSGALDIAPGATCSVPVTVTLNRTLNNAGVVTTSSGAAVLAGNGIRWNNQPGGVLDLLSSATWDYTGVGARPTFQNSGTVSNGVGFAPALNWTFTNSGLVWARAPQLNLTRGFTQIAGESVVDAAATLGIPGSSTALVLGGILEGTGTVGGNVANAGTVHPGNSPGILGIGGNFYTNLPGGRLAIDIGGRTAGTGYSQLQGVNTSTEAVLGGALDVSFVNGFVPALGDSFTIVAFPSVLAKTYFTSLNGLRSGNGLVLVPVYGPASVRLVAAQDPTLVSPAHSGNQFSFSFLTTAGLTNVVEYSDALVPPLWHVLTNVTGDGTAKLVVDPSATVSNRFYRVRFL